MAGIILYHVAAQSVFNVGYANARIPLKAGTLNISKKTLFAVVSMKVKIAQCRIIVYIPRHHTYEVKSFKGSIKFKYH